MLSLHEQKGPDFSLAREAQSRIQVNLFPKQKLTAEGEEEEEDQPEEGDEEGGEGGDEKHEEEETINEGEVPNTTADLRFFSQVGVGLTERESILLQQSIQKLVRSKPIATAHFWGKVMGVDRDYYVVEAEFNEGERPHDEGNEEEEKNEENPEDPKEQHPPLEEDTGPNTYSYFVCTALGGKWTLLPDIKPDQIVASRSIKQMFTGDLNAPVLAPPGRFEGTEKELLRTFIARVVHSCTLAPKGLYDAEEKPEEEDQELDSNAPIVMDEEWVPKPLNGMDGFVHRTPCILPQGRVEFWAPETEEEEEGEPKIEKGPPILRPISKDEPIEGNVPSWSMRIIENVRKHYWLRSNTWPGLNILSTDNGDKIVMLYFGWGMKATRPLEWPPLPEPKKKPKPVEEEEEEEKGEKNEEEENGEDQGDESNQQKEDNQTTDSNYDSSYSYSNA
ncbi:Flagellar radial spoke protein [Tritrichomonas foetus]|uniref:Flagellar radial spoke protein n=1 Tax=Tritrichomonas foetus TaxID=1144522 RepID=A0A1J4JT56_9EUKA|nr:Flagellar radial spoke protein [Tritrichomonas foetus]|eukprot:OHT01922.1 Flagellar radial spoke protein [Tritrichomonas foetus]